MAPDVLNLVWRAVDENAANAFRIAAQRKRGKFALDSAGAKRFGDGDELRFQNLLENLERETAVQLHARRSQQSADGTGRAALFPDHFAEIAGGNAQFKNGRLLTLDLPNHYLFGQVHKSLRNIFDEFSQCSMPYLRAFTPRELVREPLPKKARDSSLADGLRYRKAARHFSSNTADGRAST